MQPFILEITGTSPLLMHNSRLSNPLDPAARALKSASGKRQKTIEDHEAIARIEHAGSLYLDPDIGPYIPGQNIARALTDGARLSKLGMKITRGLFISSDVNPLGYTGPRDADGLWSDENFRHIASAKVGTSRIMRTRPIFREWRTSVEGLLDTSLLEIEDLRRIVQDTGALIGLGDWRPRFGRFEATVMAVAR